MAPPKVLVRGATPAAPAPAPPKVLVRRAAVESAPAADAAPAKPAVDSIHPPPGPLPAQADFLVGVATEPDAPRPRRAGAAAALALLVKGAGGPALAATGAPDALLAAALDGAAPAPSREGALLAITALAREGRPLEAWLVPSIPLLASVAGDKHPDVRAAAADAVAALCRKCVSPAGAGATLDSVLPLLDPARRAGEKTAALTALRSLMRRSPAAATARLTAIVPAVTSMMCDAKADVAKAASRAGADALALVGNPDLAPAVPAILHAMAHPAAAPECVTTVAGTTFVQPVEAPTLAVLVPLIVKGLRTKATVTVRKTALITANMAKLVYSPRDADGFFPVLLPLLEKAAAETANPECRGVVEDAVAALRAARERAGAAPPDGAWSAADAVASLTAAADATGAPLPSSAATAVEYAGAVAAGLAAERTFDRAAWTDGLVHVLGPHVGGGDGVPAPPTPPATPPSTPPTGGADLMGAPPTPRTPSSVGAVGPIIAAALASARAARGGGAGGSDDGDDGDSDGDDGRPLLCDCEFSLAYGGKILLSNARMKLRRGARYGLCGGNGVGKSTLMRAVAGGKVDGFPPRSHVRTAYVESNIDADADTSVAAYVYNHPEMVAAEGGRPDEAAVDAALEAVGFDEAGRAAPVDSLSGGWKMKLALARAMLLKADIMLLDEPTNHLDVTNVAWIVNYLTSLPDVTLMIVSHNSGFLDAVCTHILHYAHRRLTPYRGNLSAFVQRVPSAASYYSLASAPAPFKFPQPGILVGVSSRDRAILKLKDVSFTYPGAPRPQLVDVAVSVSLSSRIAVRGANGAGKSTLIKLLTGETLPDAGTYWKHPSLRVAYVAQHAFHHVEKHLDDTPLAYLQWRWGGGEDREAAAKATRQVSAEEAAAMAKPIVVAGEGRIVEGLVGRRKHKSSFEYEIKWKGLSDRKNTWMHRDELTALGFGKAVDDVDAEQATREGLMAAGAKEFTATAIIGHLGDFGLDAEFAAHSAIRGLSGGQKVKVVLAAACWNCPHIVVLDEPTNFLDRDSLAALVAGLDAYAGGVVCISHCKEFTDAVCDETWDVGNHRVSITRRPGAAVLPDKEKTTVSVFLPRSASGKDLALEGDALDAAILEAARLKEEKKAAAKEKKAAKDLEKKLRAARKY